MKPKIGIAFAIIALVAVSSLCLAGVNASMISSTASNTLIQRSYVRVNGVISEWGTTPVNGALQTQAATITRNETGAGQLAMATAIWTTNTSRPISAVAAKQNFTYTFYAARLNNASVSTLSTTAVAPTDYFLNGTWNIYTVTDTVTIITNAGGNITSVHRASDASVKQAYGELNVTDSWTKFTLSINGIDPLTGSVVRSAIRQVQFNPFKVTDDTVTTSITKADIVAVMNAYGAMPGWGNFNIQMDFCGHFKIDAADLSTVASNM